MITFFFTAENCSKRTTSWKLGSCGWSARSHSQFFFSKKSRFKHLSKLEKKFLILLIFSIIRCPSSPYFLCWFRMFSSEVFAVEVASYKSQLWLFNYISQGDIRRNKKEWAALKQSHKKSKRRDFDTFRHREQKSEMRKPIKNILSRAYHAQATSWWK